MNEKRISAVRSQGIEGIKPAAHLRKVPSQIAHEAVTSAASSPVRVRIGEKFASRSGNENIEDV